MATPKTIAINGKNFEILRPIGIFSAIEVNKNLTAIFGPLLMGQMSECSKMLLALPAVETNRLFTLLLSTTRFLPDDGSTPLELQDPKNIDAVFAGDLEGLYSLAFSVIEYEGWPFFKGLREQAAKFLEIQDRIQTALSEQAQQALAKASGSATPTTAGSHKPTSGGKGKHRN